MSKMTNNGSEIETLRREIENLKQQNETIKTELEQLKAAQQVVCPDCKYPYDHRERLPKQLPCRIHTSCIACAEISTQKSSDQSIFHCNLCGTGYFVEDVGTLRTNNIIFESLSRNNEQVEARKRNELGNRTPIQVSDDIDVLKDEARHPGCKFHPLMSSDKICINCFKALCSECAKRHKGCGDSLKDVMEGLKTCGQNIVDSQDELELLIGMMASIRDDFNKAMVDLQAQTLGVSKNIKDFYTNCRRLLDERENQMQEGHKNDSICTKLRLKKGVDAMEAFIEELESKKKEIDRLRQLPLQRFPGLTNILEMSKIKEIVSEANSLHGLMTTSKIPKWRRRRLSMMEVFEYHENNSDLQKAVLSAKEAKDHCIKFFVPKVTVYKQDFMQTLMYVGQHCSSNINPTRSTARSKFLNLVNNNCVVEVQVYDYKGDKKTTGGEEEVIEGVLKRPTGEERKNMRGVTDNNNGTYIIEFVPSMCGYYSLFVEIFGQSISNMPLQIEVVDTAMTRQLTVMEDDFPKFGNVVDIAADIADDRVYILEKRSKIWKVCCMKLNGSVISNFQLDETNTGDLQRDEKIMIKRKFRQGEEVIFVLCTKQKKVFTLSPEGKLAKSLDIQITHSPHTFSADNLQFYVGDYKQQSIFVFGSKDVPEQIKLQAEYVTCNGYIMQFMFDTPFPMEVSRDDIFVIDQGTNTLHQMNKRGMNMRFISLNVNEIRVEPGINITSTGIQKIYNFGFGRDDDVVVLVTSKGICTLRLFNATIERFYACDIEENVAMGVTANEYVVLNLKEGGLYIQQLSFTELFPTYNSYVV